MYISTEVYVFPVPLDFETRKVLSKKCICVPLRPITDSKQFRGKISSFRIISVRDKSLANWIVSVEDSPWSRVIDTRLRPSLNWAGETIGLRLSSLRSRLRPRQMWNYYTWLITHIFRSRVLVAQLGNKRIWSTFAQSTSRVGAPLILSFLLPLLVILSEFCSTFTQTFTHPKNHGTARFYTPGAYPLKFLSN